MYTIGQVSKMFGLPVSTLRYYDKEGLFPAMERRNGIRRFGEAELEALRVIECLKVSGLEIRDIKRFMQWCTEGPETYLQRKELFERRLAAVHEEIAQLQKTLAMLEFKCWYYDTAIADGGEDRLASMLPDKLPPDVQALYDIAHS
ncbi:MAG: MerR family transcriptional regulator [Actinomycetota bacterium]|nr:MerR family transcriptional regulator [Actinomycetota bacterium]